MASHRVPELAMSLDEIIEHNQQRSVAGRNHNLEKVKLRWSTRGSLVGYGVDARDIIRKNQRSRISDARHIINRKKILKGENLHVDDWAPVKSLKRSFKPSPINIKDRVPKMGSQMHRLTPMSGQQSKLRSQIGQTSGPMLEHIPNYMDYDDMSRKEAEENEMRIIDAMNSKKPAAGRVMKRASRFEGYRKGGPLRFGGQDKNPSHFNFNYDSPGFRLLVSNLDNDVTSKDIHELFAYIGPLREANIIRPGTAEIIYKSLRDAEKAVASYHNREFDGKPMCCALVGQYNTDRCVLPDGSRATFSSNYPDAVDLDAVHAALFGKR